MEGDLVDHEFLEFFDIDVDGTTGDEFSSFAFPLLVAQFLTSTNVSSSSSPSSNNKTTMNGPQIICKKMVVDDPTLTHGQRVVRNGLTEFAPWTGFDGEDNSDDEDGEDEQTTNNNCGGGIGKKRRRTAKQKPVNPDADLIAAATEENFKLLNLDPESKEGKRQRRRIRNRLSAQFHRERKKNYIVHLENLIKERDLKLQEVALLIDQLTGENNQMRYPSGSSGNMGMEKSGASHNGTVHYSSTVSTTFTDDEHSLSEDATDGGFNFPTPPPSPMLPMFDIKDNRGRSSLVRKGVSLLSVFFMLGVTLFGPPSTQDDPHNGNTRMTVTAPITMGKDVSYFETPLQLLQLPKPQDNEPSLSSSLSSSSSALVKPSHGRVILSTQQQQQQQEQPQIIISPIASKPSLFINTPVFGTASGANLGLSQPMWKYQSHVADLYPSLARFQPPGFATNTNDNDFTERKNRNTTSNPKRRHLRSRSDQHSPSSSSVNVTRMSSVSVNRRTVSLQQKEVKDDEEKGEQEDSMMSLVPVLSTLSSPSSTATGGLLTTSTLGESSISNSLPSSSVLSMSRVLLTSGRALLDPAMVMRTGSSASPSMGGGVGGSGGSTSDMTSDHRTATALSTWIDRAVGGIGSGSTTTNTGNNVNSPPVVSVGVNMGSNINVAATAGVAGVTNSGNMLVMLLPASSVRWGKVWGESSEGTMEALLSGMNVDDKTTNNGTTNENDQSKNMDQEGMWVEIGCSVFKAQLVRNVTLSA